jgi:hypothetical protein
MDARTEPVRTVAVGLLADPGLPEELSRPVADGLPDLLGERVDPRSRWQVDFGVDAVPLDADGYLPMDELVRRRKREGWTYLVYLTDLPRSEGAQPVLADVGSREGVAVVSLPALAGFRLRHRVRNTVAYLLDHLAAGTADDVTRRDRLGGPARRLGLVPTVRQVSCRRADISSCLALVGLWGRLRLLFGMVRANRPWRLVPHLSRATAAAAATAAFGIFYNSIWSMADALSTGRLALVNLLAVAAMAAWLLLYNHLWEHPAGTVSRAQTVLYNASTVLTILFGVLCMYAVLYAVTLSSAAVVISDNYLQVELRHPVDAADYARLTWLSCSMGIVAGALGSSMDSEGAVRQATYSRRERERQERATQAHGARDDADGGGTERI